MKVTNVKKIGDGWQWWEAAETKMLTSLEKTY